MKSVGWVCVAVVGVYAIAFGATYVAVSRVIEDTS